MDLDLFFFFSFFYGKMDLDFDSPTLFSPSNIIPFSVLTVLRILVTQVTINMSHTL